MGNATLVDSALIYVEHFTYLTATGSVGSALTITGSATGTYNGTDINNSTHKGGKFFINFTTIGATCTVRFNIQSKDPLSGLYITVCSLSLDGLTTGNINSLFAMHMYPGIGAANNGAETNYSETFTKTMRVQASITATASVGGAAVSLGIGLSKVV